VAEEGFKMSDKILFILTWIYVVADAFCWVLSFWNPWLIIPALIGSIYVRSWIIQGWRPWGIDK
jgi:hypothetical protein